MALKDGKRVGGFDWEVLIYYLLGLLFLERLAIFFYLGPMALADADDVGYVGSAIYFAKTGILSVWSQEPTAGIMPGITLLAGSVSYFLGEGMAFMAVTKLILICLGTMTGWFLYRAARLFVPAPYALLAAACLLMPNRAWIDNLISTETPYLAFFSMNLYYMLKMRWDKSLSCTVWYGVSFVLALLFRANILVMPVFGLLYLILCRNHSWKEILGRTAVCAGIALIFLVPWTIRNALLFDEFIPITDGAGDPTLKGSYQGDTCPGDDELDYETNVYSVVREKYSRYFGEDGEFLTEAYQNHYRSVEKLAMAKYRMREWFSRDPGGFLRAYLFKKPVSMLNWVYYWGPYMEQIESFTKVMGRVNLLLCAAGGLLALLRKQKREIILFLAAIYFTNIYIISCSYAVERYAALLMPLRYLIASIGVFVMVQDISQLRGRANTGKTAHE